jgi:plastocyanin
VGERRRDRLTVPLPRRRTPVVAASVAALLALSACGDDFPDAYTAAADATVATRAEAPTAETVAEADDGRAESDAETDDAAVETFPASGAVEEVWAIDNTFRVADIEVEAGTEVLWTNRGRNEHDVRPVEASEDWGVDKEGFLPGDEYGHVFDTPGVYDYYCTLHATPDAGMIGRVVVVAPES